jgi:tRNA-2-methylthio-N6-dimethylallyladenosine synthase
LVHFEVDPRVSTGSTADPRPGDLVDVTITYAAPHHLVSDAPLGPVRRTPSGDAWEARNADPKPSGTLLGLPTVGVPEPLPAAGPCGVTG